LASGLSTDEVEKRREAFGENLLTRKRPQSPFSVALRQFRNPIALLLAAAAVAAFAFGEYLDFAAILVVMLINAGIGFVTELKGVRSMEALE